MEYSWPSDSAMFYSILLVFPLLLFICGSRCRRNLNLPPGPCPWPIIGNLNLMGSLPHRSIHSLSQKYGPIMQLWFGSFPVVVGSSVEMAKLFLKTHDANFASRPRTAAGKYTTYNYSDMVWATYGPYWRQARKIFLIEIFSPKRLQSFEFIRVQEIKKFLFGLYKSTAKPVHLKDHLSKLSLNVISRMVLGKNYTEETEQDFVTPQEYTEMLQELFYLNGVLEIGDSIPCLGFLDLQGHIKRMKALMKKLDRFYELVLHEHNAKRKSSTGFVASDMVDVLLQLADDPTLEFKLERDQVKALIQVYVYLTI